MRTLNSFPLSGLRTIEAIGRNGNLVRAAAELGVTSGALSQRLAKTEAALGQALFIRTSTGLKATESCNSILPRLSNAMSELGAVVAELCETEQSSLTITVAPIFASRWLIWRIQKFYEQNPNIGIRIEPNIQIVDLDAAAVDVGIRVGKRDAVGPGAHKLLDQRVFPVCSPELSEMLKEPADLFELPVIRENDTLRGWQEWLSPYGLSASDLRDGPAYGDGSLCLDAAMTGQGVFMAWETLACDALERGQISSPFQQRVSTGVAYWFATSRISEQKACVQKFRSWLEEELKCSVAYWQDNSA